MKNSSLDSLPEKGTYTLIIFVADELKITVGKLGTKTFPIGHYAYTGSALGKGATSLPKRVERHLRKPKTKRWHIDFLLADKNASIEAIITITNAKKLECRANQFLKRNTQAKILVPKFGASDCKTKCQSHLLFFGKKMRTETLVESIAENLMRLGCDTQITSCNAHFSGHVCGVWRRC